MKKNDYWVEAISTKIILRKDFLVRSISALIKAPLDTDDYILNVDPKDGELFYHKNGERVDVTDGVKGKPLFAVGDPLTLPAGTLLNQPKEVETTIGRSLVNAVLLAGCFGDTLPYINKQITINDIMAQVTPILVDTGDTTKGKIQVKQMNQCITYLRLFKSVSTLVVYAATPKTVVPPKGLEAFKKKILSKYKPPYSQQDLFEIENALKEYDEVWLKDDPSNGIVMAGKAKNLARVKMFLAFGSSVDIGGGVAPPIVESLYAGLPNDKNNHAVLMDGVRGGSYARGASTVLGGVTTTRILSNTSHLKLLDKDCKTKKTITRRLNAKEATKWTGLYYLNSKKKPVLITKDNIESLDKKYLDMRTPMRCVSPRGTYCRICSGENLFTYKDSLQLAVSSISSVIMASFMSKSHASAVSMSALDFDVDIS